MAFISYGQTFFYVFLKMYCFCAYSSVSQNYPLFKLYVEVLFALSTLIVECDDVFPR